MTPSSTPRLLRRTKAEPVVLVDRGREVDLAERLLERLAHLPHDDLGELFAPLRVQPGHARDERGAVGDGRLPRPGLVRVRYRIDGFRQFGTGDGRVLGLGPAGGGIDNCVVAHAVFPCSCGAGLRRSTGGLGHQT